MRDREDGCIGADAQRQRQDRDDRKGGPAYQVAESQSKIMHQ